MAEPETTTTPPEAPPHDPSAAIWPYFVPFAGFIALTALEGRLPTGPGGAPSPVWYPLGYAAKVLAVSALAWRGRAAWRDLRPLPPPSVIALAAAVGLAVIVVWVGLDGLYPQIPLMGKRTAFDPVMLSPAARLGFLSVRLFGLVLLVPLVEELFYRSFLIRWIENPDFTRVPIGKVTPLSLIVTSALFGLSHPEYLPAILTGLAWGWLLWKTKSVSACVVSHAVANLALGVYVLVTHAWKYW